jgi:hypothetical protein
MEMVCNQLSSYLPSYATAYRNGRQPLYATQVSYPRQYATTLGDRLWKWYVTDCLVTYPVMQPLIEMVGNRFMQPFMEMVLVLKFPHLGHGTTKPRLWLPTLPASVVL